jgi:kynureninase
MGFFQGGKVHEVAVMNSLTINLHLLMIPFYRPTESRYKILMEYQAFASDIVGVFRYCFQQSYLNGTSTQWNLKLDIISLSPTIL